MRARLRGFLGLFLALAASAGCGVASQGEDRHTQRPELGLLTSLPIYWGEGGDVRSLLSDQSSPSWVRQALERRFAVVPLDTLDAASLARRRYLVLAQPRPLDPTENVALDDWVRQGGRLLLFADPLLTAHSPYGLGDKRRAQDVALLSPILRHWGLETVLDDTDVPGERLLPMRGGARLPVDVPGRLQALAGGRGCSFDAERVIAVCKLQQGKIVVVADAHVLSTDETAPPPPERPAALDALLGQAFGR